MLTLNGSFEHIQIYIYILYVNIINTKYIITIKNLDDT